MPALPLPRIGPDPGAASPALSADDFIVDGSAVDRWLKGRHRFVVWFRNDLRIRDNPILSKVCLGVRRESLVGGGSRGEEEGWSSGGVRVRGRLPSGGAWRVRVCWRVHLRCSENRTRFVREPTARVIHSSRPERDQTIIGNSSSDTEISHRRVIHSSNPESDQTVISNESSDTEIRYREQAL